MCISFVIVPAAYKVIFYFSQCKADPPFQYNSKDDHYNVDRTSFTGKYDVVDDRPR